MDPAVESLLKAIASHGILGLVAALAIWWAIRKDREANEVRDKCASKLEKNCELLEVANQRMSAALAAVESMVHRRRRE